MAQTDPIKLIAAISVALSMNAVAVRGGDLGQSLLAANSQAGDDAKATADNQVKDQGGAQNSGDDKKKEKSPEEKMQARFPQPVRVSHLIGLPVLDFNDSTIGYVQQVVRTPDGKIRLVVPYGKRFGWARDWWPFNMGRRPVAVPIEVVAILALQIDALDMARSDFDKAPTWVAGQDQTLPPDEMIKIAVARR
jgi:sporulation protein YlmC with PRC-barrel domain